MIRVFPCPSLIQNDTTTNLGFETKLWLTAAKVLIPPSPLLDAMTRTKSPPIDQLVSHRIPSHTLATLRDALLKKLRGGELNVGSFSSTNYYGRH